MIGVGVSIGKMRPIVRTPCSNRYCYCLKDLLQIDSTRNDNFNCN